MRADARRGANAEQDGALLFQRTADRKLMTHPTLGRIRLAYSTFQSNDNPDPRPVLDGSMTQEERR